MYHFFVSLHHWTGINLLGVLLLCLLFVPLAILAEHVTFVNMNAVGLVALGLAGLCCSIDLWVRRHNSADEFGGWYFRPFAGGAFAYLPVWLIILAPFVFFIIFAVVEKFL